MFYTNIIKRLEYTKLENLSDIWCERGAGRRRFKDGELLHRIVFMLFIPKSMKQLTMESTRQLKVGRLVQKELSAVFVKEGQNIYGKVLVSITMVRMSTDLSVAKVYLSIFPNEHSGAVLKNLNEAKSKVRHLLGQKTKGQMRIIPELIFYFDDSAAYFEKIDGMLKGLDSNKDKKEE